MHFNAWCKGALKVTHICMSFLLYYSFIDPVVNVTVTQSPQVVSGSTAVNLSCKASGDVELVSWTKNGQIVGNSDPYSLLDGNYTLQIKTPDSTYSGNYTCNASNPVSWRDESWELLIPCKCVRYILAIVYYGAVAHALQQLTQMPSRYTSVQLNPQHRSLQNWGVSRNTISGELQWK